MHDMQTIAVNDPVVWCIVRSAKVAKWIEVLFEM